MNRSLSVPQDAILGSLCHFDPVPVHVEHVLAPIRFIFNDDPEWFTEELFYLRALGLVWVECESGLVGYTAEGRAHVEAALAEKGTSIAQLRLEVQNQAPTTFNYSIPFADRIVAFLADREMVRKSVTGEYARVQ